MKRFASNPVARILVAASLVLAAAVPGADAAEPRARSTATPAARADNHTHVWVKVLNGRKWIPPVTAKKIVGYDAQGKPIYQEVTIRAGYWKNLYVDKCNICGRTQKH